ncbi:S1 family peptidase [Streptomyces sp. NPDC050560]|uniref:S1 family peptidase n=1 Tax=Streptomyces sp. NPDC050560 TaxID=3365630 RepID=UPI0037A1B072
MRTKTPSGRSRIAWGTSLLLAAAAGLMGLAPASSADAPDAPAAQDRLSPGLVEALRHDLGLTPAQATARLHAEADATAVAPAAQKAAGDAYGGSWFDAKSGRLVVAVTEDSAAGAVHDAGADTVRVAHTQDALAGAQSLLDRRAKTAKVPAAVHGWHIDTRKNVLVADVAAGAEKSAAVTGFLAPAQRTGLLDLHTTDDPAPSTVAAGTVGGDPYYINGNVRCSIGFSVVGGFVSAGHCGSPGASVTGWDGSAMGSFAGSSFPGNDYSYITIGNGWWTEPVVLGWGTVSDVLVRGHAVAPVGTSICRSGSTTHWHCGTVQSLNDTVNYAEGSVSQLTGTSVCAEPGDSGGSFIAGDQAQGVTSGTTGNCTSGGRTWFQPVNEILNTYGLTLVTSS